jgi:hypothetical protein
MELTMHQGVFPLSEDWLGDRLRVKRIFDVFRKDWFTLENLVHLEFDFPDINSSGHVTEIDENNVVAVLGNGCGKSTLFEILSSEDYSEFQYLGDWWIEVIRIFTLGPSSNHVLLVRSLLSNEGAINDLHAFDLELVEYIGKPNLEQFLESAESDMTIYEHVRGRDEIIWDLYNAEVETGDWDERIATPSIYPGLKVDTVQKSFNRESFTIPSSVGDIPVNSSVEFSLIETFDGEEYDSKLQSYVQKCEELFSHFSDDEIPWLESDEGVTVVLSGYRALSSSQQRMVELFFILGQCTKPIIILEDIDHHLCPRFQGLLSQFMVEAAELLDLMIIYSCCSPYAAMDGRVATIIPNESRSFMEGYE